MPSAAESVEIRDRRFKDFVLGNALLETLAEGFRWTEGPLWMGDWNCLLFQDLPRNRTMRWSEQHGVTVWRAPSDFANGQARDREGRVVACTHRGRSIVRVEHDGSVTTLADRFEGRRLNSPNDVVVKSDGTIWFTDPLYGISNDYEGGIQTSEQRARVYRLDPEEQRVEAVSEDFDGPNGIAFSPDERRLDVAETGDQLHPDPKQFMRAYDVTPDGRLSGGDVFHKVEPGYADGFKLDEDGNVWTSAGDGVHCIDPQGRLLGKVLIPNVVGNVAWGEPHANRLFIAASGSLFAIYLNRRGARRP